MYKVYGINDSFECLIGNATTYSRATKLARSVSEYEYVYIENDQILKATTKNIHKAL